MVDQELLQEFASTRLHNKDYHGDAWDFRNGPPEFFAFRERLIVPGGWAIEFGCGDGRLLIPPIMMGMNAHGIDKSPLLLDRCTDHTELARQYGANPDTEVIIEEGDIYQMAIQRDAYDLAILGQFFVHEPDIDKIRRGIQIAAQALRSGGHIWIRAAGDLDCALEEGRWMGKYEDRDDVVWTQCGCTGELQREPIIFLRAWRLVAWVAEFGLNVVHTQTIPTMNEVNIMNGEDWQNGSGYMETRQMLTVIAQKP